MSHCVDLSLQRSIQSAVGLIYVDRLPSRVSVLLYRAIAGETLRKVLEEVACPVTRSPTSRLYNFCVPDLMSGE